MSDNIHFIDSLVQKLAADLTGEFEARLNIKNDETRKKSASFVLLATKTLLDLTDEDAFDCLTEGGQEFGVDAMHIGDVGSADFVVTLFNGKYKQDLAGTSTFPQTAIEKVVQAIRYLFDPKAIPNVNRQLLAKVKEIHSLIDGGAIPRVRAVMCSNGQKWNADAQGIIDLAKFPPDQVSWDYVNHDGVVRRMQAASPVNEVLRLSGRTIVEEFNSCRVLVGKIRVEEIAALFNRNNNGDPLLERNVRRFLGLQGNRVNEGISRTLQSESDCRFFYFFNNGITLVCTRFTYNELQPQDHQVQVEGLQIINGGQTCKTIQTTLSLLAGAMPGLDKAFVLVRLYELPANATDLVRSITHATNSQNPVDLRDLKSNDDRQRNLETAIKQLGYAYHRHRSDASLQSTDISSAVAAEAVLCVWRESPHLSKYQGREHFGQLYDRIFSHDLNGAQLLIATLLFRVAENKRRRPPENAPDFLPYASGFVAMLMGRYLLSDLGVSLLGLTHVNFARARATLEEKQEDYFKNAVKALRAALKSLYGKEQVSLQRLAATFRRGDLIEELA